jgi:hypothetical protein
MRSEFSRIQLFLVILVLVRALFHVIHWPVFEGPDEPFHLDRALANAGLGLERGSWVRQGVVDAIHAHPCGPVLRQGFGCSPFQGSGAFNILEWKTVLDPRASEAINYEMHQPPLYYLLAGTVLRARVSDRVEAALLLVRLLSFLAFAASLLVTCRLIQSADIRLAVLLALLLPGAMESLVRGSNDALVFLWAALILLAFRGGSMPALLVLSALGPVIKLSALAVCAVIICLLWFSRRRALALGCSLAALLVFPLQALRGWRWGGTYELNLADATIHEPVIATVIGFGRSVYTFAKTIFWIGGWSTYRAPLVLVIAFFVLLVVLLLSCARRSPSRGPMLPHMIGILVAVTGFVILAVANRRLFGSWGGLGGWYFWGWFPWIAVGADDLFEFRTSFRRTVLFAWLIFLLLTNVLWFGEAIRLYGPGR